MTAPRAQTVDTPDGQFVIVESAAGTVVAAGWADSVEQIAAQAGITDAIEVRTGDGSAGELASAAAVRAYYAGDLRAVDAVPVAPHGTELQGAVWEELRRIEPGTTVSYGELTGLLGKEPTATRAVASACGRNPVGLFIPCHRVVASDGALSGFAWGLPVKASLLEHEMLNPL